MQPSKQTVGIENRRYIFDLSEILTVVQKQELQEWRHPLLFERPITKREATQCVRKHALKNPKILSIHIFIHLHRDEWKLRYLPRRRNLKLETRIGRRFRTPWMTGCKSGTESKQQLLWWGMLKGEKERRATDAEVEVGDVQLVGVEPFEWNSENVLGETEVVQMQEHQSWTSLNT